MSDLAGIYRQQRQWRDWPMLLDALPTLTGQSVLDLGCGVGDLASELVARGAHVIGVDGNEELLQHARSRQIPNAEFRAADLREDVDFGIAADGIWCSFVAAYFVDLPRALERWTRCLKPGGWIAITEIDDLFGHSPLSAPTKELIEAYCDSAAADGRYDFRAGRKVKNNLERAGFVTSSVRTVRDLELSFDGPAHPAVWDAWRQRFERMTLMQDFLGREFPSVRDEFLDCLRRTDHRSTSRVFYCIATKRTSI